MARRMNFRQNTRTRLVHDQSKMDAAYRIWLDERERDFEAKRKAAAAAKRTKKQSPGTES